MLKPALNTIKNEQYNKNQTMFLPKVMVQQAINEALQEDLGRLGDITTQAVIPEDTTASVVMRARKKGCIAGIKIAKQVFETIDNKLNIKLMVNDGDIVEQGEILMKITGLATSILMAERVALNFAGRMSGIATKTYEMQKIIKDYKAKICSTRKTTPNFRIFEKYAVKIGGGYNHRLGLDDTVLIKDNHIAMGGGIEQVLMRAKSFVGHTTKIEIEVDNLEQLQKVVNLGIADIVMLDNMSIDDLKQAVKMVDAKMITEASGNVNTDSILAIAKTGIDMISVGALTHSATNFDIGLDFID